MRLHLSPSRCGYALAALLWLAAPAAWAQTSAPENGGVETLPAVPADPPAPADSEVHFEPLTEEALREGLPELAPITADQLPGNILTEEDIAELETGFPFGYNLRKSDDTWLVGGQDQFGMFSLEGFPSLPQDKTWNIDTGIGIHFLNGPVVTDMPPRLFDFQIGYQNRKWLSDTFGYDVSARVGIFSDFEGSAREGVRFPAHAVGYYRWLPNCDFVFGAEYLNRDDVQILPVAGLILTPRDDLRLELVFPRPRASLRVSDDLSLYLAGELGGGTWAIERVPDADDVVTYHDLRLLFGVTTHGDNGGESAIELGYVFDRELTYRSGNGNVALRDAFMIRLTQRY